METVISADGTPIAFDRLGSEPALLLTTAHRRTLTGQPHNVDAAAIAPVIRDHLIG